MNEFNPLEKIIFKRGIFEDLSDFAKNYKKIAILTSKTPKKLYFSALNGFFNEKSINYFTHEFNSELEDFDNLVKAVSKCKECDLIISFGAGKVTDLSKLVAKNLKIPYVVVPSTISHFGYFTNYAYKSTKLSTEKIECDFPKKIFIDENIIKSSPDKFILSTCCFIFSFLETSFSELFKQNLFGEDNIYIINSINKIINKTEGLINWLNLKKDIVTLNLMDNLIELFTTINSLNCDYPFIDLASQPQSDSINFNFGKCTLINANALLKIYEYFWQDKNICYKNIPNYEKIMKILQKNGKKIDFFENFIKKYQNLTSNNFFFKIKSIRPNLCANIILTREKLSKICKRISNLYSPAEQRIINEESFYEKISYVSLTSNCFQLNSLMRLGYLNF